MLTLNIVSANPLWGDEDSENSAQQDSQAIEVCRERYLSISAKAQRQNKFFVLYTYDQLYKLGCEHQSLSEKIDVVVGYELRLSPISLIDQINTLYYGPYIQSQLHYHKRSESFVQNYICEQLGITSSPPTSSELSQQPAPITAA